ncbi:MtlR transcriptional regulator [Enterococcus faecium]|uniref:MtlR transcriptional regulator n=1 Tax=Enterococcus faecium TaxID=1352 RepID=UPI001485AD3F|nr:MtlR transcriptional regulator [Enterococcus faecium]
MKIYKVLSVCGSGVATSTLAATKLSEGLEKFDIDIEVMECKMTEVKSKVDSYSPDVIINTTEVNKDDCKGIEVFSAVPFLTGMGEEQLIENVANYLTK